MSYLIDTHCHLDVRHSDDDLKPVIERACDAGVKKLLWVGIDPDGCEKALKAAETHDEIYVSVGVHPHDSVKYSDPVGERFRELASHPKVVAIGETGLDFYRDYSPRDIQLNAFREQCKIAVETGLPVILHSRAAPDETWEVVSEFLQSGLKGTFHCYAYDLEYARKVLDSGFYISVNGILTYPRSQGMRDMVAKLPLDRLILETDAPFLLPQKYRRKDNEPAFLLETFRKLVEIFDKPENELMETFRINSENCFPKLVGIE